MIKFNKQIQDQFSKMTATGKLFRVKLSGQELWDLYLNSFSDGADPMFRDPESSVHNCNHCNNFIRRYGNVVSIKYDLTISTLFDFEAEGEFQGVAEALSLAIKSSAITNVFIETYEELHNLPYEQCSKNNEVFRLGVDKNTKRYTKEEADKFGVVKPNELVVFNHMFLDLPALFVSQTGPSPLSIVAIMGKHRDDKEVFKRGMDEIPIDTLILVRDLIKQESLLDSAAHLSKVEKMIKLSEVYKEIPADKKDNWCWIASFNLPYARFKGELIGTLCTDLAQGVDINTACRTWNKRVDPANYMKVKSPITDRQRKEAAKFAEENGYLESFDRRLATLGDIKVSEILHINSGTSEIKKLTVFDKIAISTSTRHRKSEFDGVEEVHIDKFMSDILPLCQSVEVFLTSGHTGNMVNITTPVVKEEETKPIFKWDNNYSWTFNGNLAGKSQIKEAVKMQGGAVDGVLNFRLAWNSEGGKDASDLDIWAQEPDGTKIGYNTGNRKGKGRSPMSGQLDVDNTNPRGKLAVENITWNDLSKMKDGRYTLWVNQYSFNNSKGFKAEIEFEDEVYFYEYLKPVSGKVNVATIILKGGKMSVQHQLPETGGSSIKEIYGLETNQFHKVNLVCLSPNHWGENEVGNKHFLFMLEGCHTDQYIRTFHNENLVPELLGEHRKVMDVLGDQSSVTGGADQLAGLGFNSMVRDEVIVRLSGSFKRTLKIKF